MEKQSKCQYSLVGESFLSEAVYFIMHTLNFIVYKYHVIKLFFKLFCFYQCLNYGVLEKYGSCC